MSILTWLNRRISRLQRARFYDETENNFLVGSRGWNFEERDRLDYDREEILRLALEAWRVNPLARRIVGLTTQYVVGGGLQFHADHPGTHAFLDEWWNHALNQLPMRVYEWCDELTRCGELFVLISTDAAGMSYMRAIPASAVQRIQTAENDLQQETSYELRPDEPGAEAACWPAYLAESDARRPDGSYPSVMLHYAINRPVGAVHGESDLAPLLRWLARYAAWLEDRARLNRYRNAFLFVVKGRWASEAERHSRQAALSAAPPSPGSFLVVDESEEWSVLNPQLESAAAGEDGLALKKMVAAGAGLPLHFLAEPEGSNRSTAESAGGPTYRHFEQRQEFFTWLMADVARAAVRRRALVSAGVQPDAPIRFSGADLSARDNAALAVAASTITNALSSLRDRGIIDDAELLRLVYRFAGEVVDVEALLERGQRASPPQSAGGEPKPGAPAGSKVVDIQTGEGKGKARI